MGLTVVSTPIGHYDDITLRAIESLRKAQAIICEERKPASILLKKLEIPEPPLWELNEHSRSQDLQELLELCRSQNVCLVSDCGTPAFCDPGAALVDACLKEKIPVDVNPGPSSLMALLSVAGVELKQFYFVGFLPAEKGERSKKMADLKNIKVPVVIMDTPYRLQATLQELAAELAGRKAVLGVDLTGGQQQVARDSMKNLASRNWPKLPFVLLIQP